MPHGERDDADPKLYDGNPTPAPHPTFSVTLGSRLSGPTSTLFTCGAGTAGEGGRAKLYVSAEKAKSTKTAVSDGAAELARAEKERDSGGRDSMLM